jgi:hypothetical protein
LNMSDSEKGIPRLRRSVIRQNALPRPGGSYPEIRVEDTMSAVGMQILCAILLDSPGQAGPESFAACRQYQG